jgi:ABC-type transporter Mla subunit MlaD
MDAGEFYEFMDRLSALADKLAPAIDAQQEINKNLQAMIARHDARLDEHQQTFRDLNATLAKLDTTMDNIIGYIQGRGQGPNGH